MNIYHINTNRQLLNSYLKCLSVIVSWYKLIFISLQIYLFQRHTFNRNKTIAIWEIVDVLYTVVWTAKWRHEYMCL